MLVDSHSHLDLREFDDDRDEVIKRARRGGIGCILTVGINLESCSRVMGLIDSHDFIYGSIGIHPHDARDIDEHTYKCLKSFANNKKVLAFGEIGLDFYRNRSPRDVQIDRFREQINVASELGLPLIIHDRDAHKETVEILTEERGRDLGGVIHCFSGDHSMAKKCMDMGFYISVPGTVTFPKAKELKEVVKKVPLSNLLIETDCPFLTPVPYRGKRNEPMFVRYVAEEVASLKGVSVETVAEVTSRNFSMLFSLPLLSRAQEEPSLPDSPSKLL